MANLAAPTRIRYWAEFYAQYDSEMGHYVAVTPRKWIFKKRSSFIMHLSYNKRIEVYE